METNLNHKETSLKIRRVLERMEQLINELGSLSDELMIQHLIESGEINPNDTDDFINRQKHKE